MSRPVRRLDRQLDETEAWEVLQKGMYGVLSTADADGMPYGVPLSYVLVDHTLYFHGAKQGHKVENILCQPRVTFCVVGETQPVYDGGFSTYYESTIVQGRASIVEDLQQKEKVLTLLCEKYLPDHVAHAPSDISKAMRATLVVAIEVSCITGKAKRRG